MSYNDGHCDLCGQEAYCHTKYYGTSPFIDGKYYEYLCWVCYNSTVGDTDRLKSLKEMKEDGFGETEAKISYNAISKSLQLKLQFIDIFNDIPVQTDLQF